MKVGFNARLLFAPDLRGWNRYTVNLLAALPACGIEPVLYADRPLHPAHLARLPAGGFEVVVGAVRPYAAWEQFWLPWRAGRDRVAVLHAPANFGLPWSSPCPRVLTLHDAIPQAYDDPRDGLRARLSPHAARGRLAHWLARSCAERVITVSEHARGDLISVLGLSPERVRVIPEAADPSFFEPVNGDRRASALARYGLGQRPYVFYVGGWERRKKVPFLVRGFADARLDGVDLVLAGGRDDQRAALEALADSLGVKDRLRLLGWVDDADLPALYAGALAFAYPSEYEGFGLQLCEAMAVGCPLLAARATSLPEVLGEGGETFALDDPAELTALLRRVAADPCFRARLSDRARARADAFSWARAAEATAAVYRELIDSHPTTTWPRP
jgi:glycosyltransferase involved in cell wall biosynthesis